MSNDTIRKSPDLKFGKRQRSVGTPHRDTPSKAFLAALDAVKAMRPAKKK